ncbi:Nn.00g083400.m01.CDS01 [Neocucurbitaria sp. VM-36]
MADPTSTQQKPVHSLILDTGPLIKNAVSISTIVNSAEELYTTPAILSEIRDEATRSRVQTTLMPFLKIKNPSPASYDAVIAFSKKTGDYGVLSRQDLGILALAYEIHCEKHGGSFGLREAPKQPVKRRPDQVNKEGEVKESAPEAVEAIEPSAAEEGWSQPRGKRATKAKAVKPMQFKYTEKVAAEISENQQHDVQIEEQGGIAITQEQVEQASVLEPAASEDSNGDVQIDRQKEVPVTQENTQDEQQPVPSKQESVKAGPSIAAAEEGSDSTTAPVPNSVEAISDDIVDLAVSSPPYSTEQPTPPATDSSDSDSDGDWITPSNLPAHQAKDSGVQSTARTSAPQQLDVATMTVDFAMQNVLLQMNLKLLSTNMQRIKHLTTKVLRCHACFNTVKQMDKQFCPRCGQSTLQRVSCSTNAKGEFKVHLSKNYQWNKRGDKYSVPKPIAGTANGKWSGQGGGKGGWGRDLILAEDQKEYQKQVDQDKRSKTRDLMDEDYLPGILTGDRGRAGGRPKVGAGRNVNSKKRV